MKTFSFLLSFLFVFLMMSGQAQDEININNNKPDHQVYFFPGSNQIPIISSNIDNSNDEGQFSDTGRTSSQQILSVTTGWEGLSSYIIPDNPDIEAIFSASADKIDMLYNLDGFYIPSQQINTLGNWNPWEGYIAKFNEEANLAFTGQINQNRQLDLAIGWNLIPVLSACEVDPALLFEGTDVAVIKEVAGYHLYWPDMGIHTLETLLPGKAYFVLMSSTGSVNFPDCEPPQWACGDPITDIDGNIYNTVQIGDQCWMAENLNIGTMINGSQTMTDNSIIEKYCYDNDPFNCDTLGGLYQWNEAMQYATYPGAQGICPDGWHLPADDEWKILEGTVDSQYPVGDPIWDYDDYRGFDVGKNLKASEGWVDNNGTDNFGFSALPGGFGGTYFSDKGYEGHWWSSSGFDIYAWDRTLYTYSDQSARGGRNQTTGFSVRCILNGENQPPGIPSNPSPENGSIDQPVNSILYWTCSDPEYDPLTYDVYIGESNPPPLQNSDQTESLYDPGMLSSNTTYYWKITAHDDQTNTTEGPVWSFTTGAASWSCGDQLTDIDGNAYNTVQIGDQCWMAENLKTTTYSDGTPIPNVTDNNAWGNQYSGAYAWYYNDITWKDKYGALYNWHTTVDPKGVCPNGWHVPSNDEWTALTDFIGGTGYPHGNELKSCRQVNSPLGGVCSTSTHPRWNENATNYGTDDYGFSGLPGGSRDMSGNFDDLGIQGNWSTSTEDPSGFVFKRRLFYAGNFVGMDYVLPWEGNSIRCIKDTTTTVNLPPDQPSDPSPQDGSTDQSINSTLNWSCSDPENDPLTYDIYFGGVNPPAMVNSGQSDTSYNPGILNQNTTYYWKVVAHDLANTTEGPVWSFTTENASWSCGDQITDIDGNAYNTVQIGTQCWMQENLKTTTYNNGTSIPNVTDATAWSNLTSGAYVWYNNDISWKDKYGALYNWFTTVNPNGLCPTGWHVPTNDEWTDLTDQIGGTGSPHGNELKSCRQVNSPLGGSCSTTTHPRWDEDANNYGTDNYGFSGLPGGYRHSGGYFGTTGIYDYWWSSTENISISNHALGRSLIYYRGNVNETSSLWLTGHSIRCLQD